MQRESDRGSKAEADIILRWMNLLALQQIHLERGDVASADEAALEAYELLKAMRAGVQ